MKYFQIGSLLVLLSSPLSCAEKHDKPLSGRLPGKSIFQLASNWKTQDGKEINISRLEGKVTVLAMIYTSCRAACPRIIADVKRIEKSLEEENAEVQFVLVSMDPENDPPEKLLQLVKDYRLDTRNWILLTGDNDGVLEMANAFDVRIRRDEDGGITDHSNLIFVLDKQGVIAHRQEGLSVPPDETVTTLNNLLR